jgi:hypothetical protein
MCNYGVVTVSSNNCSSDPAHVWYKSTYILCNNNGQRCANARQTERQNDPSADNNYAVGSRSLGPCHVCVNLDLATRARDEAMAKAQEIKRKSEEAYAIAVDNAYHEVKEV